MADYFRKSIPALFPDGKVRKVRARAHVFDGSLAPDTFFSIPAGVTLEKKYISGFLCAAEEGSPTSLAFHPYTSR